MANGRIATEERAPICHLLFAICYLLFAICYLLFAIRYSLFAYFSEKGRL